MQNTATVGMMFLWLATCAIADNASEPIVAALSKPVLDPNSVIGELQTYCSRMPPFPMARTPDEWQGYADRIRQQVLDRVVFRGEAARWRDAQTHVEWFDTIDGGPGYRIRKLRYEALPGLWIPALLYVPEKLEGKVPVVMNVNGHDGNGKAAVYKQIRCINLAKRGMIVLNPEWLGMGQLREDGFRHSRMNQLDLCGTSGLAPFYLAMKRGIDILVAQEHADPERLAVAGLSGGGWQTIIISSLDTRVKLANPVAGYSSFLTRLYNNSDMGDSEQTPCDLATVADYTHLTALLAPRPALLTYNIKDDCCFAAGHALPPLLEAARPVYRLHGTELSLRPHVNHRPGTHNFDRENREALYRMVGDFFYAGVAGYDSFEIASDAEVKTGDQLKVDLPADNANFHTLAASLAKDLPRGAELPSDRAAAVEWQRTRRTKLRQLVAAKDWIVEADKIDANDAAGLTTTSWRLRMAGGLSVPATELSRGDARATTLLVADAGRKGQAAHVERLLAAGHRVVAVDPFYFGESRPAHHDYLFALHIATIGDRALGVQASQLAAVARWAMRHKTGPVTLAAVGPRSSVAALVAAGLEEQAIARIELTESLGSLKEVIEKNSTFDQSPELFCFGLLQDFDVRQLAALVAPRPVKFVQPSDRVKAEVEPLRAWYETLGARFDL
jgi:dienelactone hydrolase